MTLGKRHTPRSSWSSTACTALIQRVVGIIQDGDWAGNGGQRAMLPTRLRFAAHLVLALRVLREAPGASEELQALDDLQVLSGLGLKSGRG